MFGTVELLGGSVGLDELLQVSQVVQEAGNRLNLQRWLASLDGSRVYAGGVSGEADVVVIVGSPTGQPIVHPTGQGVLQLLSPELETVRPPEWSPTVDGQVETLHVWIYPRVGPHHVHQKTADLQQPAQHEVAALHHRCHLGYEALGLVPLFLGDGSAYPSPNGVGDRAGPGAWSLRGRGPLAGRVLNPPPSAPRSVGSGRPPCEVFGGSDPSAIIHVHKHFRRQVAIPPDFHHPG